MNVLSRLDEKATQKAVDEAFLQLQKATFDLRQIPSKEKLEELIKETEAIDFSLYTEASVKEVKAALAAAKKVVADENAVSKDVRSAVEKLEVAVQNLEEKSQDGTNSGTNSETNSGTTSGTTSSGTVTGGKPGEVNQNQAQNKKPEQSSVKTGDQASVVLWLVLAASMLVVLSGRKRRVDRYIGSFDVSCFKWKKEKSR